MTPAWWSPDLDDSEDRGQAMVKVAKELEANPDEGERQDLNLQFARMFEGRSMSSLYQYSGNYFSGAANVYSTFTLQDASTWNVLRSVCATAAAMIGRSKPRARFVTSAGSFKQKRRAKAATQFTDGWANEEDVYSVTYQVLIDSLVFDYGCLQLYEDGGKVKVQRVLASEVICDPLDGLYGKPRTIYRRRFISKDALIAKFGKSDDALTAIENAQTVDPRGLGQPSGLVQVWESWHLPSGPKSKDGYHVIAIDGQGGTLFKESYEKPYFPILFLRWEDALAGFGGRSLASQLAPLQEQLNSLLMKIEKAQRLMAVPRVAIQRGSKIVKSSISNQIAGVVEYTTTPPQALIWPAMPAEVYKWVEELVQKAYDLPGISRNAASGVKETGTTSGAAIRESLDVQATRMQVNAQRWERFHVDLFRIVIDMVSDIVADGGRYAVAAPGTKVMDRVDWRDIRLDANEYTIQVYPVSQMPISPQGRLDYAQDMIKAGLWDATRAKQALEDLDIDSANSLELAVQHLLEKDFEAMLYDGEPRHPDELTPYDLALRMGGMYLALGKVEGAPPKHLDLVRRFLDEIKQLQSTLTASQPPPANDNAQAPAAPQAALMPAPLAAPLAAA